MVGLGLSLSRSSMGRTTYVTVKICVCAWALLVHTRMHIRRPCCMRVFYVPMVRTFTLFLSPARASAHAFVCVSVSASASVSVSVSVSVCVCDCACVCVCLGVCVCVSVRVWL
jgi:hypothetical protein